MILVLGMIIFLPDGIARYALLIGTLAGWAGWYLLFRTPPATAASGPIHWQWFPLGYGGQLRPGIILTALLAGLVNITNTYGAIRGTDVFIPNRAPVIPATDAALLSPA
jgi:xanthine/uracil permease